LHKFRAENPVNNAQGNDVFRGDGLGTERPLRGWNRMANLDAAAVARLLREIGQRMELKGGNPYRAKAYSRAAESLSLTTVPLDRLIKDGRLKEIPGVGEALAAVITQLHETGRHATLEKMREEFPEGVLEMLRIPGLRPERVRKLYDELGIASLSELEEAARADRLKSAKGFGPAFQAKLLQGITMSRSPQGRHLHRAASAFSYAISELERTHPALTVITEAGEFRRGCEIVRTLSLVAVDPHLEGRDDTITAGDQLSVRVTRPERYGIALLLETGSEHHLAALRALAAKKGWTLDTDGLRSNSRILARKTEEEIYSMLGLPFIAPELRETGAEVELAAQGRLPELVTGTDIRGVLHAHTDQSDGADTLDEMAKATRDRGYAYLGLTDHSQTASYAGGLKVEEVLAQQRAVDRLNKTFGSRFHVFKGIESDILADGSLDYAREILDSFDLIIASVHSRFRMSEKEQTDRIVKAVSNPHTTVLGHVTGRQLLRRPGYEVDMERILRACAEHEVAVEINANPWRLDLDWRWCTRALELGCMFSINPDAHSTDEIDNIKWGVLMARKGAVPKDRVLTAMNLPEFGAHLAQRKTRAAGSRTKRRQRSRRASAMTG
jgi:DNA polymerase (family X)